MFCSQAVEENKTRLRSSTLNFEQDVSVLKQLRTGVFFCCRGDNKCGHKTIVSLRIHFLTCDKILSRNQLRQFGFALQMFRRSFLFPSSGINHSEKSSWQVMFPDFFSISQREITLSCCVTNQSMTRFINSHYRLLATHTHTHTHKILRLAQCTYSCQLYQHASKYFESGIHN